MNKQDKIVVEIVDKITEPLNEKDIQLVMVGGRTLNFFFKTERVSDDSDFAFYFKNDEQNCNTAFQNKIKKALEKSLNIDLRNGNEDRYIEYENNKVSHYKNVSDKINTVVLYINNEEIILDFTYDNTISDHDFIEYINEFHIGVIIPEYTISAKKVIIYKRMNDFENFINRKYYRHIYDLYRLYVEEEYEFDHEVSSRALSIIINYDMNIENELHRLDKHNKEYIEDAFKLEYKDDFNGKFYKTRIDLLIAAIELEYDIKINKEIFEDVIKKYVEEMTNIFFK